MTMMQEAIEPDFDFESRQLCADGNCTGVLDTDGNCKVCCSTAAPTTATAPEAPETEERFDSDRELCPDGACTGLLGDNGVCKECGRRA